MGRDSGVRGWKRDAEPKGSARETVPQPLGQGLPARWSSESQRKNLQCPEREQGHPQGLREDMREKGGLRRPCV